ncbi:glycoside hydrolase family 26 protein [Roseimarinus sediminis]|uniref:glycoside hydrolase family 26 protein n=1 Tax=Roseimarinus sediminis TaxID=1610899 RepID=UPI003D2505F4
MKTIMMILLPLVLLNACNVRKAKYAESEAVSLLRSELAHAARNGILFGHQDDLAYGIGWKEEPGESDVKRTAGDYPALFGWEIGHVGDSTNIDGVPFASMVHYIQEVHRMGGVNTISWHARHPVSGNSSWTLNDIDIKALLPEGKAHEQFKASLDKVAVFISQLTDDRGELIPVIFRPWHEMYGGWFWWGSTTCSNEDYIALFRFTVDYLRNEKGLNNLLMAYSPDSGADTPEKYLSRYPGDDVVDLLGIDNYGDYQIERLDQVVQKLSMVVELAAAKNKLAAFTETGCDRLEIDQWYTSNLLQVLRANEHTRSLAYVMVWRNRDEDHFYVPYPGHAQAEDFKSFADDGLILLLEKYRKAKEEL